MKYYPRAFYYQDKWDKWIGNVADNYCRKDIEMTKKAVEKVTTPVGVEININGNKHMVSEVEFVHNYMEMPRVIVHGNINTTPTPTIKDVIFNPPATIVFWTDNTKTVVKSDGELYDPEKGIAMAISRKMIGDNKREYYNIFRHYLKKWEKQPHTNFQKYIDEAMDAAFEKYHEEHFDEIHEGIPTIDDYFVEGEY